MSTLARITLAAPRRQRYSNRRLAQILLVVIAVGLVSITVAGLALGQAALATDFTQKALPPSTTHLFGTDWMGRDLLVRTTKGLSTSILIGCLAAVVSAVIALVLGIAAALGPRWLDAAISWLIDMLLGIPHLLLLILISIALGRGLWGVTWGVALTHWPALARVIRAEIIQARTAVYVGISHRLGHSGLAIARRHMLPLVLPQFLVGAVLIFPHAILHEAAITFLGFGLAPEQAAVGIILSESMTYLSAGMWWSALFPGLALIGVVMVFDALGGTLRTLTDPVSRQL